MVTSRYRGRIVNGIPRTLPQRGTQTLVGCARRLRSSAALVGCARVRTLVDAIARSVVQDLALASAFARAFPARRRVSWRRSC
jgi:hypothetical protein